MEHHNKTPIRVSRRTALRASAAAGATALLATSVPAAQVAQAAGPNQIEPNAGAWKTWLLSSGSQMRLPAPPNDATTKDEINQLQTMVAQRDAKALDRISYWDSGSPGYRWNEITMAQAIKEGIGPGAYQVMALVNAAIYDATIAAWDSKYAFNRQRPSDFDPSLKTVLPVPNSPSYPSEHAVAAGAASAVLAFLFPKDAQSFMDKATDAAQSRVLAGV